MSVSLVFMVQDLMHNDINLKNICTEEHKVTTKPGRIQERIRNIVIQLKNCGIWGPKINPLPG